jgi:hypothetical protein
MGHQVDQDSGDPTGTTPLWPANDRRSWGFLRQLQIGGSDFPEGFTCSRRCGREDPAGASTIS